MYPFTHTCTVEKPLPFTTCAVGVRDRRIQAGAMRCRRRESENHHRPMSAWRERQGVRHEDSEVRTRTACLPHDG